MSKKSVMVTLEFGVMELDAIETILAITRKATVKYGGCTCFDVWSVEVDGTPHDPDDPTESLW